MLPEWVSQPVTARPARTRRGSRAVAAFLHDAAQFLARTLFLERLARQPGWLQRRDARAKLVAVLGLLVCASFLHHALSLWLLTIFAVLALTTSRVGLRVLGHRAWWLAPGLFALAALPAALNIITPGRLLVSLLHSPRIGLSEQGLASVALFASRLVAGVLLALTLTLTTRAQDLLRAAYTSVTAPFVFVLAIMQRHLFLLLHAVEELHLARRARTLGAPSPAEERQWAGRGIGFVFRRARQQTEAVYQAMLARGYTGRPRALRDARLGWREAGWLGLCAAVAAGALLLDRLALGRWSW